MYSYLMNSICKTGIFIICAQVLVHLRPKASYEKYLKMLMSAMILMQLFLPVSTFFTGEGEKSLAARVAWFEEELRQSMEQIEERHAQGESILEQMTLEELQSRIEIKTREQDMAGTGQDAGDKTQDIVAVQIEPVEKIGIQVQSGNGGAEGGKRSDIGGE